MAEDKKFLPMSDPRNRHFRVVFNYTPGTTPQQGPVILQTDQADNLPAFDFSGSAIRLLPDAPATRLFDVGQCIYCGATKYDPLSDAPLSEEHVVPEALGARLILGRASCKDCQERITIFEGNILGSLLRPARRQLNMRGKKRRRGVEEYPIYVFEESTSTSGEYVKMSLADHPSIMMLPVMEPPGLYHNPPKSTS